MKSKKNSNLFQELAKQKNVKFLNKEETQEVLANTEFNGCIARPKNNNQLPQEVAQ